MQIESLIRPKAKATRTVNCYGRDYVFKELTPGRFIAQVDDEKAADALLRTGAYREYTDELPAASLAPPPPPAREPKAQAPKQTQPVTPVTSTPPESSDGKVANATTAPAGDDPVDPAVEDAAKQLLSGPPTQVRKAAKSASGVVLTRALAIETSQEKPRPTVVALLQESLAG